MIRHIPAISPEELEGHAWPAPSGSDTYLVKSVYELRKQPVCKLRPDQLARLVGQSVGLQWTLPVSIEVLRNALPSEACGGFYDDDLLSAVLTQPGEIWRKYPELAKEVLYIIGELRDVPSYIEVNIVKFRESCQRTSRESDPSAPHESSPPCKETS